VEIIKKPKSLYGLLLYFILVIILGEIQLKKIMAVFMVGILLVGISSASAIVLPKADDFRVRPFKQVTRKLTSGRIDQNETGGNFSGQYAMKNESGFVFLGSINGSYEMSSNYTGTFEAIWNSTDGNESGNMSGWYWGQFYLGEIEYANDSYWFIGIYRVNTSSNEFYSAAIIFSSPWIIRYAAGTYT
jgi:hypothetical protein